MALQVINDTSGIYNAYPNLPVYQYVEESVSEADVAAFIKTLPYSLPVQASTLAITLNESGDGQDGILTNLEGFQADNSAWDAMWNNIIIGTTVLVDSTGTNRRFVVFDTWQHGTGMLAYYVNGRGIYTGANATQWAGINPVVTPADVFTVYARAWIYGDITYQPAQADITDFTALLNKSTLLLTAPAPVPTVQVAAPAPAPVPPVLAAAPAPAPVPPVQAAAPAPAIIYKMQVPMMVSPVVGEIQTALQNGGYYFGDIDNEYWTLTFNAVRRFQAANPPLATDGEAGPETLAALGIS